MPISSGKGLKRRNYRLQVVPSRARPRWVNLAGSDLAKLALAELVVNSITKVVRLYQPSTYTRIMLDTNESGSDSTELELAEDEGDTTCPLCEDFEGPASSVQAHISGSTDENHAGRMGNEVMVETGDTESSEKIEFPENPDQSERDEDLELDEEPEPGGTDESGGSQTDPGPDESPADPEADSGLDVDPTDVAVMLGAIVALVAFLRGGDFSMEENPDVPEVMLL